MLTDNNPQYIVDKKKIERERERFRLKATEDLKKKFEESPPNGIYFDAKNIMTCKEETDSLGNVKRRKLNADQFVICTAQGEFIESFEMEKGKKQGKDDPYAKAVAKKIFDICRDWNILDNLHLIGGDTGEHLIRGI